MDFPALNPYDERLTARAATMTPAGATADQRLDYLNSLQWGSIYKEP